MIEPATCGTPASLTRRALLAGSALIAISTAAPAALAQDTAAPSVASTVDDEVPGEILVTARKRQESLLDVPVVIQALGQAQIEREQIHDITTLQSRVPGLVVGTQIGAISAGASIRGVGTTATNATIDQSVSLNIDGLQLSQSLAYRSGLFDLGQIEVLKGPQALFFGKNSPAGVISLRSADPTSKVELILRGGYEVEANEKVGEAIISGPVSDTLKLRLSGQYTDSDGYFRNRTVAPAGFGVLTPPTTRFGSQESVIVRSTALFAPSSSYDARLKLNYAYDFIDNGGTELQLAGCPFGKTSFTGLPAFDPNEDCKLNRDIYVSYLDPAAFIGVRNGGVPFVKSRQYYGTLEQNIHAGPMTITWITGAYVVHQSSLNNGSGSSGTATIAPDNNFFNRSFTQEIRAASDFDGPVNFLAGAFYQDGRMTNEVKILGNTMIPGRPISPIFQWAKHRISIESISPFAQLRWNVTPELELTGGARYTYEHREHIQFNLGTPGVPLGRTDRIDPRISASNVSPEATISYKMTPNLLAFASYKQGFKSGSFNTVTYIAPTMRASFNDERVRGGEGGLKGRLFDRQVTFNLAGYYYRYSDLQVGANEQSPGGGVALRTLNAASAVVKGIDFDAAYAPAAIDGLTLRGAVNYNRARYANFANAPCGNGQLISEGCDQLFNPQTGRFTSQDLSGRPITRAPKWVANAGFDYERPISRGLTLQMGAAVNYSARYYAGLVSTPILLQSSFAKVNANIGLRGPDNAWDIAIVGNNLTDRITTGFCANGARQGLVLFGGTVSGTNTRGPGGGDYPNCAGDRGREVWLRLTVRPFN